MADATLCPEAPQTGRPGSEQPTIWINRNPYGQIILHCTDADADETIIYLGSADVDDLIRALRSA
jgi:hypothetical protein